jgi:kynurenine formamidase
MIITLNNYTIDLSKPIDISLPLTPDEKNPVAWYQNQPDITPVKISDSVVGKVSEGNFPVNFNNIIFNPHAHGTHTECFGHLTRDFYSVNKALKTFFFLAKVISVNPAKIGEDLVITKEEIATQIDLIDKTISEKDKTTTKALVIRTLPNTEEKKHTKYSNTNPPYVSEEAAQYLRKLEIDHLLVDLPSVDREYDEGKLLAHKAFWNIKDSNNVNSDARFHATITEFVFVPNEIKDGLYLLNLQIASFENDASPSKPVLYNLEPNY